MARRRRKDTDGALMLVVTIMLCILAMPIAGLVLALSKDPNKVVWGWILMAVGIVLWVIII